MHTWLQALAILVTVCVVSGDGDDCAKTLDTFATCLINIRKDKDVQEFMKKKLDIVKDCGASEKSVKCLISKNECQSKAEEKVGDSSERKDALKAASKCWTETKNPMEGMEEVFHGLNFFGPDSHRPPPPPGAGDDDGPPPPPGGPDDMPPPLPGHDGPPPPLPGHDGPPPPFGGDGPPPPPGAVNSPGRPGPPRGHHPPPPPFGLPDECKLAKEDKSVMNCTMKKIIATENLAKVLKFMQGKLKDCKQAVPKDCKPRGPGIFGCLLDAYKPAIKLAVSNYKDCMDKAGYKVPDVPFPPEKPGEKVSSPSSSNSTEHD